MPARCVIGVDLGGTKLLAAAVDSDLAVHHRTQRAVAGLDTAHLVDTCVAAVDEARASAGREVEAAGFGIPATLQYARGVSVQAVHLPLRGVPFRDLMAERLGVRVAVDNDANAAALAELRWGAARGARQAVILTIGTGIGTGLIVDGRIYRGATGAGGEFGHMTVDADGERCTCGNEGCLEAYVSGPALVREAERAAARRRGSALAGAGPLTGARVTELAHDGDPDARAAIAQMGRWFGIGLASIVNALEPEVIVVGGGVMAAGELLLAPARAEVLARALPPGRDQVRIVSARFGPEAGMIGAAALALDGGTAAA